MIALLSIFLQPAHAFCGSYVGTAGSELFNEGSEVVLARENGRTTLTMANDFEGPLEEFAMVVPVPIVLTEDDVNVLDPAIFERLEVYSGPRLVSYTCEELFPEIPEFETSNGRSGFGCTQEDAMSADRGDTGWATDEAGYGGTNVESQFIVGEYEVVVLSADESLGMLQWLSDQGYAVSPAQADLIQDYLDEGAYFFAARVFTDRLPAGQTSLSPLQFSYDSESFGLPIRLGTANSTGEQDLVIYTMTSIADGRVGISNYEEATLDSVCLYDEDDFDGFGDFYDGRFTKAIDGEARWVAEYGWTLEQQSVKCDPCPPEVGDNPFPISDVFALGYTGGSEISDSGFLWGGAPEFYFTRLHIRYTPEQATQDLVFYTSGISENIQQRYVQYEDYLESEFPVCDFGFVPEGGSCADESREMEKRMKYWESENDEGTSGCSAADARWSLLLPLAFLSAGIVLLRRREEA